MKFFVILLTTIIVLCGKVNFTNLSRYRRLSERTYRRQFQNRFEFASFKRELIEMSRGEDAALLGVMDCSFLAQSGKASFGLDRFWHGCSSPVERGLEVSVVGVVDTQSGVSYALSAQQTYAHTDAVDCTRMDQYRYHLECVRGQLPPSIRYLAVDGAFAKADFVAGAMALELHVVSKLRRDANLRYLYTGAQKPRGRRRKYDGKVDVSDLSRFEVVETAPRQCLTQRTQSSQTGCSPTASRPRSFCLLNGESQAACPQSPSPGALYCQLRPGAKLD
jgi:hypothetical protein